jgi:membrane-bound ClpP family serine protease
MIREGVPVNAKSTATAPVSATAIATALKTFARTLSQHSERQSDLIDVFATALKELQTELHRSKIRNQTLQNRLDVAEARIAELEKVVGAMRRQGWVN